VIVRFVNIGEKDKFSGANLVAGSKSLWFLLHFGVFFIKKCMRVTLFIASEFVLSIENMTL